MLKCTQHLPLLWPVLVFILSSWLCAGYCKLQKASLRALGEGNWVQPGIAAPPRGFIHLSMPEHGRNGGSALLSSDPCCWDWKGIWTVLIFCDFRYEHIPVVNPRDISVLYECNTHIRHHWRVIIWLQLSATTMPGLTQGKLDQEGSSSSCQLSEQSQSPEAAMKPYKITAVTLWWGWWWFRQPSPKESHSFHYKVTE